MMGRSEVWRWSRITWSCPGGMEDRKVTAVVAAWWCHRGDVTNFIWPYLHQFFIDSHGLNGYGKPLKRPFDRY